MKYYLVFRLKSKVFDRNTRYFDWNTRFFIWNTRYFENMWQSHSILSPLFFSAFVFFCFCFFAFLFYVLFSLSLTPTIGFFYCLNYTSLLLRLITTHFIPHFSLSSITFIISALINIFYCLSYTSLLLHLVNTFYNNYVVNLCPRQLLWFI